MIKLLPLAFILSSYFSGQTTYVYTGNDSTYVIATIRTSCVDSVKAGLKEYCEYHFIIELKK